MLSLPEAKEFLTEFRSVVHLEQQFPLILPFIAFMRSFRSTERHSRRLFMRSLVTAL